jgi:hypothetical protein
VTSAARRNEIIVAGILLTTLAGCGAQAVAPTASDGSRIGAIVSMHNKMEQVTGRLPPGEKEFKQFINENGAQALERAGATTADDLLVSNRDGQPYVITYAKYPTGMTARIVAYEKNGADGKRFVGYNSGAVELVEDARFDQLIPTSARP